MGRRLDEFLDGDALSSVKVLIARALTGAPAKAELALRSLDGRRAPIQLSVSKMKIEEPTALCLVATDLAESKKWEELIAAGKLTNSILESSAEGIVVCDRHGHIQSLNTLLKTMSGRTLLLEHFDQAFPLMIERKGEFKTPFSITMALHGTVQSQKVRYRFPAVPIATFLSVPVRCWMTKVQQDVYCPSRTSPRERKWNRPAARASSVFEPQPRLQTLGVGTSIWRWAE